MPSQIFQQCTLEINVISAEDLRIKGRPIKKNAIAYVHTNTGTEGASLSTTINKDGGSNPIWQEKFDLKISGYAKEIIIQVCCDNNLIGEAKIPTKDIFDDYVPPHCLHLLSYRLKDRQLRRNGIINLSIRVKDYC
ncbi:BON1-associated protein 1-like [Silene latifolia]|uniref:BON1-associated protein 1-like n=1 Tax=Silene latifolia TaxID=37657 RepID=UPI003D76A6C7